MSQKRCDFLYILVLRVVYGPATVSSLFRRVHLLIFLELVLGCSRTNASAFRDAAIGMHRRLLYPSRNESCSRTESQLTKTVPLELMPTSTNNELALRNCVPFAFRLLSACCVELCDLTTVSTVTSDADMQHTDRRFMLFAFLC